jgi:hypothetical protein
VDQDIGAGGELLQVQRRRGIARNYEGAIVGIESVGECGNDWRMLHERGRDSHVLVLCSRNRTTSSAPSTSADRSTNAGAVGVFIVPVTAT